MFDVIIIGAGASGLMAAIHAAKRGRKTLVIDHADRPGRKLLISGGGKCNVTNRRISATDYFGMDCLFSKLALRSFPPESVLSMLQKAHIETEERELGRVFCKNEAYELVFYLVNTAKNEGVQFLLSAKVSEIHSKVSEIDHSSYFYVNYEGQTFQSTNLLVATGGLARPQIGATGFGYAIAKQFGHTIVPLRPALTGLFLNTCSPLLNLQGISLLVRLQIKGKSKIIEEPLLFTHLGISGPATLQLSCFWQKKDVVIINFLPTDDFTQLMHEPANGKLLVKNLAKQFLPDRLFKALIPEQLSNRKVAELSVKDRTIIADSIHQYKLLIKEADGYFKAEATLGGVSTSEINPLTMESRFKKGLFFSGEVIDITGKLGGYNIHWAFASGYTAGQNI